MNPDFRDMLSEFVAAGVEFLLVGAYAMAVHGFARATGDIDLWVRPDPANARRVFGALARFGAPVAGVAATDFESPGIVFQVGIAPRRIDVLTSISGVEFREAWEGRVQAELEGLSVPVLGREHLLKNKRATGRPKDAADVRWLEGGRERK